MIIWLINPWLGILTGFSLMIKADDNKRLSLLTVIFILTTVILFQLSLPMPYDLESTKNIYMASAQDHLSPFALSWIPRDPLSYGILNLLAWAIPSFPISFYLLNIFLGFICLWFIYKKQIPLIRIDQLILFAGLFILVLDYQETHHFLRQTTALLLFIIGIYISGPKKYVLFLASILWHGSMILFLPVLIFNYFSLGSKKTLIIFSSFFFLTLGLSYINIYDLFSSEYFTNKAFVDFSFADRFLTYFRHTRHARSFTVYRDLGNPLAIYYICLGLFVTGYSFIKKRLQNPILPLIMIMTLWIVFFRYHILIYDRLQYGFIILLLLFWTIEMSDLQFKNKKVIGTIFICLCFLKIIFFNWTLDTNLEGRNIYTYSPVELVLRIKDWPINQ